MGSASTRSCGITEVSAQRVESIIGDFTRPHQFPERSQQILGESARLSSQIQEEQGATSRQKSADRTG